MISSFVLRHHLAIVTLAVVTGIAGLVLHIRDARRAERQEAERIASWVESLSPEEIARILTPRDRGQQ